ncbi:MAG: diphthamide biosynthesis enzyme Dph2 [Candidatus Aenigmatarchaeota archaeon]
MLDAKKLAGKVKARKAKRVLLQVPEGLKMRAQELAAGLEKAGIEVFISGEPCYGACDVRDCSARLLNCDLLVHLGHTDLGLETRVPVLYEECRLDLDPVPLLKKHLGLLSAPKRLGLSTTVQYLSGLEKAKAFLESQGKEVLLASSPKTKCPGQILGCDFSGPKSIESQVDAFLFIGSGYFHPLGISMAVEKPVLFLNIENGQLLNMKSEKEMLQRVRFAQVEKAKEAETFGILLSTKPGQFHLKQAEQAKKRLEALGKQAWTLLMNEITPEKLLGLKLDCLVNCACPRLTDDSRLFKKPILNLDDLEKL